MNEKLIQECCVAYNLAQNAGGDQYAAMQASIAAHSAFIREAAARDDVTLAGILAGEKECAEYLTAYQVEAICRAMLDQIERTPDVART